MRSKKALKNIMATLLQQLVTIICGFIVPKVFISKFGSESNGLVISITQFLSYIALLDLGVGSVVKSALYKPIAEKNKEDIEKIIVTAEKYFKLIARLFIVYIVLLIIIYPFFVKESFDVIYTASLIIIIAISSFAEYYFGITYKLFLQADQKTYITSYFQIFTTIVNTLLIVLLANLGMGLVFIKLISSTIYFLKPILQKIYVKRKYKFSFNNIETDYRLEQKWDAFAQHIAAVIHNNADVVVLTIFSTVKEVSVYSVYMLVINGIRKMIESLYNGIDASFGDMIAKKEDEHLNKSFRTYEFVYITFITIIFSCTLVLIQPFIDVYTKGITDINYQRPIFAILITLAEYVYSIRLPYSSLTKSAGHYKETKNGAWLEVVINVVLSIVLVLKYGVVGVAIGTLVAMIIRTIEFIIHTSKYILNRNILSVFFKIFISIVELIVVILISNFLNIVEACNFLTWIYKALMTLTISTAVVTIINFTTFKFEKENLKLIISNLVKK